MTLRDRVRHAAPRISPANERLAARARDASLALEERLAAFDALVADEVGDTGLHRARGLERELGLAKLYLKYEGDNPTGTQKDRIAFAQVRDALARGLDTVALATCGNYGVAVALACQCAGLRCAVYIPAGYHTERIGEIEGLGARIARLPGTYEEAVAASSVLAKAEGHYDANPGGGNAELQIAAYAGLGREIVTTLARAPDWCAVPVSNGTLLAGTHRGLTTGPTDGGGARVLAGSSVNKNPIVQSFRRGLTTCVDLDPAKVRETLTNEPLINWHAFDGDEALAAVRHSDGAAHNVSDGDLRAMAALVRKTEGYRVLPASTAGLVGLVRELEGAGAGVYVAVLTARA